MAKGHQAESKTQSSLFIVVIVGLCCFFYLVGAWQRSGFGKGDSIAARITKQTDCSVLNNLNYQTSYGYDVGNRSTLQARVFKPCGDVYVDYTPCQHQPRAMTFPRENMNYRERHCPSEEDKLDCLVPAPKGYVAPFRWPKSRDFVPYANAPYKRLTVEKAVQNWIIYEGNVFRFPGGGTQFPQGANTFIDVLASVIPLDNGMIRTALDTGCGVASWGAYLLKRNVLAMSFAPRDSHEAQIQFALERGVPAVIGVVGTMKLPYPARAFDMTHCSRCLIPWASNGGMYMMEVDRVLRPGGYWILSGPPINWRNNYIAWQRPREELEEEQAMIEEIAKLLCWEKKYEEGETAIWRKSYQPCHQHNNSQPTMCLFTHPDDVWYNKMEACITPYPENISVAAWKPFPERLNVVPARISSGSVCGVSVQTYHDDNRLWKKHVNTYRRVIKILDSGRYRNIMDMNAGFGSFAAALESPKLWVMNVMPTIGDMDTLGAIFERGLIGIYHDWCEAFSTYPRTYDLIHANGVFSLYKDKCGADEILLEMDRILRPEGAVIFRDEGAVLSKINRLVKGMRWKTKMMDHEDGPLLTQKILYAVKQYWVAGQNNSTSPS